MKKFLVSLMAVLMTLPMVVVAYAQDPVVDIQLTPGEGFSMITWDAYHDFYRQQEVNYINLGLYLNTAPISFDIYMAVVTPESRKWYGITCNENECYNTYGANDYVYMRGIYLYKFNPADPVHYDICYLLEEGRVEGSNEYKIYDSTWHPYKEIDPLTGEIDVALKNRYNPVTGTYEPCPNGGCPWYYEKIRWCDGIEPFFTNLSLPNGFDAGTDWYFGRNYINIGKMPVFWAAWDKYGCMVITRGDFYLHFILTEPGTYNVIKWVTVPFKVYP